MPLGVNRRQHIKTNTMDWTGRLFMREFGKTTFTKREIMQDDTFKTKYHTIMVEYWTWVWENDVGVTKDMFDFKADIDQGARDHMANLFRVVLPKMDPKDIIEFDTSKGLR